MSCKPFNNPLDNALSYLYTNKAIDANMKVSKNIGFYLNALHRQSGITLFNIEDGYLKPIPEAFDSITDREEDTVAVESYVERMEKDRQAAVDIWQSSNKKLPAGFTAEETDYLTSLFDKGVLELDCAI